MTDPETLSTVSRDGITPELILRGYLCGVFPMSEAHDDPRIFWVDPDMRGILPLDAFHVPKSLRKRVRQQVFDIRVDSDFAGVIDGCAEAADGREETWINAPIRELYAALHRQGFAHSVECWQDGMLVGGLYGIAIGGAFFGESMFHRATDASKVALVHLVARLKAGGYRLLDTQFVTDHLSRFGTIEIPRQEYMVRLEDAALVQADWWSLPVNASPDVVLQAITQTS